MRQAWIENDKVGNKDTGRCGIQIMVRKQREKIEGER